MLQVRLVIWKCKDVVAMDFASGLNDLFVKSWLEGCDPLVMLTRPCLHEFRHVFVVWS